MLDEKTINIFSSRDKIRDDMIEYAKEYLELEGLDFSKTSYLSYLVNILSGLTANLLYYSTSIYKEFFLTKAVQKESVLNLASFLGYTPSYAIPSICSVLVEMPTNFSSTVDIEIPKGFKYFSGDIVFTQNSRIVVRIVKDLLGNTISTIVTEYPTVGGSRSLKYDVSLDDSGKEMLYFSINVTQVEEQTFEYTVPELEPYEFHIIPIEFEGQISSINLITTTETGDESYGTHQIWEMYDSLFLIPHNIRGFAFRRTEKGGRIFFGNGVVGKQAPSGNLCRVVMGTTKGSEGNVISGSITKADRLYVDDWVESQNRTVRKPVSMRIVNTNPAFNGNDSPTITEIRSGAIANIKALKRLVTKSDYSDIKEIVPELPIEHSIDILKRSDIKSNEICLYTDLLFENTIVPTRNAIWILDSTANPDYILYTTDKTEIDGSEYYSLFNIVVDPERKEAHYFYLATSVDISVSLNRTYTELTEVLPSYSRFYTITTDDDGNLLPSTQHTLEIELYYNKVIPGDYPDIGCVLISDWDGVERAMSPDTINPGEPDEKNLFKCSIPLSQVPEENWIYYFKMFRTVNSSKVYLNESQVEAIIKKDLDDFMQSQVEVTGSYPDFTVKLYDVPVVKKTYFDSIDKNNFTLQIYNNILSFNVSSYKMATDFVNLKFSNTTGILENMKYNKTTKDGVKSVNPSSMPLIVSDGDRYIVTNEDNPWTRTPSFIAEYSENSDSWFFERLVTNDIIYVEDLDTKCLFNGIEVLNPVLTIPLQLSITVWKDREASVNESGLVQDIKNTLIDEFLGKFGFENNIYISEIIRTVQSVPGVKYCKLTSPKHDIFFDYDIYKDLTQQELLEYSPQLVWFSTTDITVEVR